MCLTAHRLLRLVTAHSGTERRKPDCEPHVHVRQSPLARSRPRLHHRTRARFREPTARVSIAPMAAQPEVRDSGSRRHVCPATPSLDCLLASLNEHGPFVKRKNAPRRRQIVVWHLGMLLKPRSTKPNPCRERVQFFEVAVSGEVTRALVERRSRAWPLDNLVHHYHVVTIPRKRACQSGALVSPWRGSQDWRATERLGPLTRQTE